MGRISTEEFYDNKDLIQQIELLKDALKRSPIKSITASQQGDVVTLTFTLANGDVFEVPFVVHATAVSSFASLEGEPRDNEALAGELDAKSNVIGMGTDEPAEGTGSDGDYYIQIRGV